jgi:hypothetical protein
MTWNLALPEVIEAPPASDPFRYGTRMARRRLLDGTFEMLRLPLTIWDVLHPQEGDHIVHSIRHAKEGCVCVALRTASPYTTRRLERS